MATIVTRAGKGSALTWTEGDANITNLNNAKIENVVEDTTPQLGGDLDVNGHQIVSASNGNINIVPNGSGNINLTPATGHVTISAVNFPTGDGTSGQTLVTSGTGQLSWSTITPGISSVGISDVSADTSTWLISFVPSGPNTVTSVNVDGQLTYVPSTNVLSANINGAVSASTLSASSTVSGTGFSNYLASPPAIGGTTASTGRFTTITSTASTGTAPFTVTSTTNVANLNASSLNGATFAAPGAIGSGTASTGAFTTLAATTTTTSGALNITYNPSATSGSAIQITGKDSQGGTGYLDFFKATNTTTGATNPNKTFRLTSTGTIEIINSAYSANLFSLTDAGALTVPSLISSGSLTFKNPIEAIYDNGNSGAATLTPNATNGSVQKYTLTGNITLSAFASPVAGQSITLILVQDGTGSRILTSTMKWAGGTKTLSTAAGSIDIATIYYDGTNYYASLAKGFA